MSASDSGDFSIGGLILIAVICYFAFGNGCGADYKDKVDSFLNLKEECSYCSGQGERDCLSCYGTGDKDCSWCFGLGKQNCNICSGAGLQWRYDYGYDYNNGGKYHYYYGQFPCTSCLQSGKIDCTNTSCDYGKVACSSCYGAGKDECTYCNGEGYR